MPSRAVLFDLDGTLADTAPDFLYSLNQLCLEEDRPLLSLDNIRPYINEGSPTLIKLALEVAVDDARYPALRARFLEHYGENISRYTTLMPGVDELLHTLERREIPWGIVTNKPAFLTHPLLDALALSERTACIVSGDEACAPKPHPASLLKACQILRCNPGTSVYVGDAKTDVLAAHRAGLHSIVASYGYIAASEAIGTWGAEAILDSMGALELWLYAQHII